MRLVLVRHGATAGNAQRRYVGRRTNEPLSEEGRAQCARLGELAGVRLVWVSPLTRARQTARLCFPQAEQRVVDDLAECDFGVFEGRTAQEMEHDVAYRSWVDGGCMGRCPGGESAAEHARRSNAALARVLFEARDRGSEAVFVVAHGGTIMAAMHEFLPEASCGRDYFLWHVGNAEGVIADVRIEDDVVSLVAARHFTLLREVDRLEGYAF